MTILSTPAAYSSLHDDLVYIVSDPKTADPVTYPGYQFVGDVYVDATLVARLKRVPDPETLVGKFNIAQIVRNYVAMVFNPTANVLVPQQLGDGVFRVSVTMKFGEQYDTTTTYEITNDSTRVFFNHYNGKRVGTQSALTSFADKVASNRPLVNKVLLTSSFCFVPYFPTTTSAVSYIVTPTGGGSVFSTTFTPGNALDMQILNLAPVAINAVNAGTINASTTSYTVQIGSETYTFKIICEPVHTPYTLHFLNKYSGFESFIFSKVSRRTLEIQKKDYGRLAYNVDGSGVVSYRNANGVYNESRSTYSAQYKEKLDLNSDLLTDGEYTWLSDLILSPMVYLEDSGYFVPVIISASTYEPKKYINDELTNLLISLEFGSNYSSQYR